MRAARGVAVAASYSVLITCLLTTVTKQASKRATGPPAAERPTMAVPFPATGGWSRALVDDVYLPRLLVRRAGTGTETR